MIILNQDKLPLNFHSEDNLVFDINTNYKLEKILEDLRSGKAVDEIGGITACFIPANKTFPDDITIDDAFIKDAYKYWQIRKENSFIPDYNVVHDADYEGDVNGRGDIFHDEDFPPNSNIPFMDKQSKDLNDVYQKYLFNVDSTTKVYPFPIDTKAKTDALKYQIAATIGIIPQLLDMYPDADISQLKKISETARLAIEEGIASYYSDNFNELVPDKDTIDILMGLNTSERQLLTCELNPVKATDIAVSIKRTDKNIIITRDMLEAMFYKNCLMNGHISEEDIHKLINIIPDKDIPVTNITQAEQKATELFTESKEYGHRVPRVIKDYTVAQFNKDSLMNGNRIYNEFNLKSLMKVAKTKSESLYALSNELNFNEIKESHINIIGSYYPKELVSYLKTNGFIEYYNAHKDISDNDLKELLEQYRNVYKYAMEIKKSIDDGLQHYASRSDYDMSLVKFDKSKSPVEQINELREFKARSDCKNMEHKYNYKFSDNDLAIKGREIEVIDRNFHMYMLPADDYRNFTIGYDTNCCQHYNGAGETCVYKLTSDPYAGAVIIEKGGKVIAQGFVWTDEDKDTIVFDNVEFNNDRDVYLFNNIFAAWAKECPYGNVHVGTSYNEGMQGWGASVPSTKLADMPQTLSSRWIYSDYTGHTNARTIKKNGRVVLPPAINYRVEKHEVVPSKFDIINNLHLGYLLSLGFTVDKVIEIGDKIEHNTLTDEEIKNIISNTSNHKALLEKLDTLSDELQLWFYDKYPLELELIKNPCEAIAVKQIEADPNLIKNIENPTKDMQIAVVKTDGLLIQMIDNPCEEAAIEAVKQNGYALSLIPPEIQTDEVAKTAIENAPRIVLTLKTLTDPVIKAAIEKEPQIIGLIEAKTPISDEIKMIAIEKDASTILHMKKSALTELVVRKAIEKNGLLIRNFQREFPSLRSFAIEQNPNAIGSLIKPTKEEIILALSLNLKVESKIKDKELVAEALNDLEVMDNSRDCDEYEL